MKERLSGCMKKDGSVSLNERRIHGSLKQRKSSSTSGVILHSEHETITAEFQLRSAGDRFNDRAPYSGGPRYFGNKYSSPDRLSLYPTIQCTQMRRWVGCRTLVLSPLVSSSSRTRRASE
ncbi:hypothetical protein J6590_101387 [Homalodisca vitripennis]|nr:hypothetical protein J6590_101387 [Homalodisca vitripennis]